MAGFWRDFEASLNQRVERKPNGPGWLTMPQLKKAHPNHSDRTIRKKLKEKNAEVFRGTQNTKAGCLNHQVWYRCK